MRKYIYYMYVYLRINVYIYNNNNNNNNNNYIYIYLYIRHIYFHTDIFRNCIPLPGYGVFVKDTCWEFSIVTNIQ